MIHPAIYNNTADGKKGRQVERLLQKVFILFPLIKNFNY